MNGNEPFHSDHVRDDIKASLQAYAEHGIPTGGFLRAALANDLQEAVGRADEYNLRTLPAIVAYIYRGVPAAACRSYENVDAWIRHHGRTGLREIEAKRQQHGEVDKPKVEEEVPE